MNEDVFPTEKRELSIAMLVYQRVVFLGGKYQGIVGCTPTNVPL